MRPLLVIFLGLSLTLHAQTMQKIGAADLKNYLTSVRHASDDDVAHRLSAMVLTERVDSLQLPSLETECPGKKCRRALLALVDQSAFVESPASQSSPSEEPSQTEQKEIMAKFLDFVERMNHQMPNFIATRTTSWFEDWPNGVQIGPTIAVRTVPLDFLGQTHTTITYRHGRESVSEEKAPEGGRGSRNPHVLSSWGLFGPMLTTVILDASKSELRWDRWQKNGAQRLAVFRFVVPMAQSTYEVNFCCIPLAAGIMVPLDRVSAYHGEFAVNPDDGTIVSITLVADLDQGDLTTMLEESAEGQPLSTADLAVEYAPVEIAGKMYTCPVKAVAFSKARILENGQLGPVRTYLDDIGFSGYHVFRTETRILTDYQEK